MIRHDDYDFDATPTPEADAAGYSPKGNREFVPLEAQVIEVLFADWSDEIFEIIDELSLEHGDIRVVGIAYDAQQVVEDTSRFHPDVIVVANGLPGANTVKLVSQLTTQHSNKLVLVMVDDQDADRSGQLIQAGARDSIVKNGLTHEELADWIRQSYLKEVRRREEERQARLRRQQQAREERRQQSRATVSEADPTRGIVRQRQQVIAFYSPKGGVGTSVLAVNTALTLARHLARSEIKEDNRLKVILVDGDFAYGNVDSLLVMHNKTNLFDVVQTAEPTTNKFDPHALDKAIVKHPDVDLDILLAPNSIENHEVVTGMHIEALIDELRARQYDIIIFDTSCELRDTTLAVLREAQKIFFLVTQDLAGLRTTEQVLDLLTGSPALNIRRSAIRIVLSQMIQGNGILPGEISEYLNMPIVATIPEDRRLVSLSINEGKPLALGQPNPVLNAIKRVASQISPELGIKTTVEDQPTGGLFGGFGFGKKRDSSDTSPKKRKPARKGGAKGKIKGRSRR